MRQNKPIYEYTLKEIRFALENKDWETVIRAINYLFAHYVYKPVILDYFSNFFGIDLKKYFPRNE